MKRGSSRVKRFGPPRLSHVISDLFELERCDGVELLTDGVLEKLPYQGRRIIQVPFHQGFRAFFEYL